MEFGIEKCAMLVMKSGKQDMTDRMELPIQDKIRTLEEKETNKYSGILEADTIKQVVMKKLRKKVMYSYGPPRMAEQKQDDQLEHTYSSYVRIRGVALKTCQRR